MKLFFYLRESVSQLRYRGGSSPLSTVVYSILDSDVYEKEL